MMPLKIAIVHPYHWEDVRRGGERYVRELAQHLAGAGHQVDVIVCRERAETTSVDGFTVRAVARLRAPGLRDRGASDNELCGVAALSGLLRRRYDVVHATTPSAVLAAWAARHRVLSTDIGYPTESWIKEQPAGWPLFRLSNRLATMISAPSKASADRLAALTGRMAEVLYPGVRLDNFTPEFEPRKGPLRVLFPSQLDEGRKGIDVTFAALALVLDARPDARLIVSGTGDFRWALAGLGDRQGDVERALDLVGRGDGPALADRYRSSTVTVLPSLLEAFGMVLVESLACGTPVVASDSSGMREIVTDPAIGRLIPARTEDDVRRGIVPAAVARQLADAILGVALQAADAETPRRCRAHVARWDWATSVGPQHEEVYRRMAAR